jgi:hypothetical protein
VTGRRALAAAVAAVALLGAAGCTGSGNEPAASASSSVPPPAPPTLAGSDEAEALAPLPAGPATGTAVLSYSGVGELDEPFAGTCAHDGDTTVIDGTADTATIRLEVRPDGARLDLQDIGFAAQSNLATGHYEVTGAHLSLSAPLAQDDQVVGNAQLEIDCG